MSAVAHLMAQDVWVDGRWVRQRCAWCGVAIIDEDLTLVQTSDPDRAFPTREPQSWVEVDEGCPTVYRVLHPRPKEGEEFPRMPANACMRDVSPLMRVVEPEP